MALYETHSSGAVDIKEIFYNLTLKKILKCFSIIWLQAALPPKPTILKS
jgi:hypothetical protein